MKKSDEHKKIRQIIAGIESDERVQRMKDYIQHGNVTTYEHCRSVARMSCKINRHLHLHCDLRRLITGAMLHDFYLYDWHKTGDGSHRLHGFRHAARARRNARKYFNIDNETAHIISCHMWPLNIMQLPKSREAWTVCAADKIVSLHETIFRRKKAKE